MSETNVMTTKQALKYIAEYYQVPSMYALARILSNEEVKVQPIQIKNYVKGSKMRPKVAKRFLEEFDIVISDVQDINKWSINTEDLQEEI